jgi:alkylation response protein AidB-like acyl-CoA dehydrogenase
VNLAPSPDQKAIKDAFADVFGRESTPARVRAVEADGFDPDLWRLLVELGAPGIAVGEDLGGAGTGLVELVLMAEELGRRIACVPLVEAAVAARTIADHAAESAAATALLEEILAGGALITFQPRPVQGGFASLVPAGAVADGILALDGERLVVARGEAPGGSADFGLLGCADRRVDGEAERLVLAEGDAAIDRFATALGRWRVATAATLAGLAAEAIAIAVKYTIERIQFGVQVGTFQALQHPLADAVTAADGAELLAREAAWRHDEGVADWREMAAIAYAHAVRSAENACAVGLHVHGGYGYTLEYDIQLFLRRAKALGLIGGDPAATWAEIGAATVKGVG